jgi:hypothetical protein
MGDTLCSTVWDDGVLTPGLAPETLEEYVERIAGNGGGEGSQNWIEISQSGSTQVNRKYMVAGNTLTLLSLPAAANMGDRILFYNAIPSGFRIVQSIGEQIQVGNISTTLGVSGKVESLKIGDWIELTWLTFQANTLWFCTGIHGNLEVV